MRGLGDRLVGAVHVEYYGTAVPMAVWRVGPLVAAPGRGGRLALRARGWRVAGSAVPARVPARAQTTEPGG